MKKLLLALSICTTPTTYPITWYQIFDAFGSLTDFFFTKGSLSPEDEQLFNEVAQSLDIADRNIKVRDSGLLFRLLGGYQSTDSMSLVNRVYVNKSCLEKMTEEQKKFIFARELIQHKMHYTLKKIGLLTVTALLQKLVSRFTPKEKKYTLSFLFTRRDNEPISIEDVKSFSEKETIDSSWPLRYFAEGFKVTAPGVQGLSLLNFNIYELIRGQYSQACEKSADALAVEVSGTNIDVAAATLKELYYNPDTTDWPLYARVVAKFYQLRNQIWSLPIFEQHDYFLPSLEKRIAALKASIRRR